MTYRDIDEDARRAAEPMQRTAEAERQREQAAVQRLEVLVATVRARPRGARAAIARAARQARAGIDPRSAARPRAVPARVDAGRSRAPTPERLRLVAPWRALCAPRPTRGLGHLRDRERARPGSS